MMKNPTDMRGKRPLALMVCVLALSLVLAPLEAIAASESSSSSKSSSAATGKKKESSSSSSSAASGKKKEDSSSGSSAASGKKKESSSSSAASGAKKAAASSGSSKAANATTTQKTTIVDKPASTPSGIAQMKKWQKVNSEVMGYLYIPGTNIDYPVLQTTNNMYYNDRDIYKKYSKNSVIWADQDVRTTSRNIILYGHNWLNYTKTPRIGNPADVMFGQLTAYHYESFAKQHPYIYYSDSANGDAKWEVFSVFYTTDLRFYLKTTGSQVETANKAKKLSLHDFGINVGESDKILTLSTCTRYLGPSANQRFVVMARKVTNPNAKTGNTAGAKKAATAAKKKAATTAKKVQSSSSSSKSW